MVGFLVHYCQETQLLSVSHLKAVSDVGHASFDEDLALALIRRWLALAVELIGMQQTARTADGCPLGPIVIAACSPLAALLFRCTICAN